MISTVKFKLGFIAAFSMFFVVCQAASSSLPALLERVKVERLVLNETSKDLDLKIVSAYLDKYEDSMDVIEFDDPKLKSLIHVRKRINDLDCEKLFEEDLVTLNLLFSHFDYFNDKCFLKFDLDTDINYFLFYVLSLDHAGRLLEKYALVKEIPEDSMKAIYDMAFVYCDKRLISYLGKKGITGGSKFTHQEYMLREATELYSCL